MMEAEFTRHEIGHFKVSASGAVSTSRRLCTHPPHLSRSRATPAPPPKTLYPLAVTPSPWPPPVRTLSLWLYPLWTFHRNGILQDVDVWGCLLSLSMLFLRSVYIIACVGTVFIFMAESSCHPLRARLCLSPDLLSIWAVSAFGC